VFLVIIAQIIIKMYRILYIIMYFIKVISHGIISEYYFNKKSIVMLNAYTSKQLILTERVLY